MPSVSSITADPAALPAKAWNARNRGGGPFSDQRFIAALAETGCVGGDTGWSFATVGDGQTCFAPVWRKVHSHGEFVFDHAWARAAYANGIHWYPKLLVAVPLTPVTGPRLLADDADGRARLAAELEAIVERESLSSCGVNFCDAADAEVLSARDWLARSDWQFHWHNDGYRDFDDFLERLRAKPRKNIRRERRLAHADGWHYRWVDGTSVSDEELITIQHCYQTTFELYGNLPMLNRAFFRRAARDFGPQFLACIASRDGVDRAVSVFWRDRTRLYGRYWGALEETRDVHFEACYYQGIDYCIRAGIEVFEPGAQGEHKIRRGFVPVATRSFHYIRHPGLREGIRRWLKLEAQALEQYRRDLQSLIPYRGEA
ncbi:MAG: peptidogalycan biosysnthesis protein [Wenzhouxiangellaceae bacterium]|nr:peptidogalycan biosysnthesis protein [Wenzhouxiangellaceae bacterium]